MLISGLSLIITLLITTSVHADWFYDTVEAIDDAGIAVSGVIVDGVNDIQYPSFQCLG
jgi:hypothetical membrane protein